MSVQKRFSKLKFEREFMRNQIAKYENFLFDFYIGSNEK